MRWGVWLATVRMAFARRPWAYWALAGAAALIAGVQVQHAVADADTARHAWGEVRTAWVVTAFAATGETITAEPRAVPVAMVPVGAVDVPPDGSVAAHPLPVGAVLTITDVRDPTDLPADWLVVAVPGERSPQALPGQDVMVVGASTTACDGRVAARNDLQIEVAVPPDCAARLTADLLAGDVLVARHADDG